MLACVAVLGLSCNASGGGTHGDPGGYTTPTGEHPHVYLNAAVKARLAAALAARDPAAVRFRNMVDGQLAGADEYGFEGWFAALLYQLTGEETYGRYAVQEVER